MQPFCVTRNIFHFSLKTVVDSWNHISIFNLSTLELDNALQRLSFAGLWIVNSAKEWVQALYKVWNWVQNGCNFEMREKEKSRKSMIYRTFFKALQDGLEPTTPWLTVRCSNQLSYWSGCASFLICGCKGTAFFLAEQTFGHFFLSKLIICVKLGAEKGKYGGILYSFRVIPSIKWLERMCCFRLLTLSCW